jgi:phenylacetate-coenzyme A ligase PaaK-like adenylate-forming protein
MRYVAQYFIEGRDLSLNRTRLYDAIAAKALPKSGISVHKNLSWVGALAPLIRSGANKHIDYRNPNIEELVKEIEKDDIGFLVATPRILDTIHSSCGLEFLKRGKTKLWIPSAEGVSPDMRKIFADLGIPIRANYSSEETGPIGYECQACPGHYHVATSNVMVEVVDYSHDVNEAKLGKVLVTHLHSYATPFIRYDLSDLACLLETCPCGLDGPTIYNLHGRLSSVIKHLDGRLSPFNIRTRELSAIANVPEFRIRQTALDKIVVEIGGRSELSADEIAALAAFIRERAGEEFEIEVKACKTIDWGQSRKRLSFRSEVV